MSKKKIVQVLVLVLLGASMPGYIFWKNIFPDFEYYLNEDTYFGVKIFKKEAGEKDFLVLPELENYFFDKVKITGRIDPPAEKDFQVKAFKGYQAFYYQEGEAIKTKEELEEIINNNPVDVPNGALFAYNDSVNVVSGEYFYPVFSEELFGKLGYSWEEVAEKGGDFTGKLTEGDRLHYGGPHPDGTILKSFSGDYYLISREAKRRLSFPGAEEFIQKQNYTVIETSEENSKEFGKCSSGAGASSINCQFNKKASIEGMDYVFQLENLDIKKVTDAQVELSATPSLKGAKRNIRVFYWNLRDNLAQRYKGHLFN
ncbi:MAG: hypothetical protein U5L10_02060 [Candidatus Moranbacteria bacterium]|nr:hypothetical protein [Candidatus Moranbacteria bacterium]